nr:immunoglobulin heavy chain junction region [Macaca mulatta]MOV87918.1 immunoglobulin heavy chain junction region [Macaca mulatta]MOV89814.1 immunoglobulin heavy chain junction region [Macaca mulatta]MOV90014.1 immunoglobulin heavy chain junction region [Macaca mulatta]MOV90562.1 immunoglobulin heavy chain junction region [Macaca mulatta]
CAGTMVLHYLDWSPLSFDYW